MSIYKVNNKISHEQLYKRFIKINTSVRVINWQPLIADECTKYAMQGQPIIRVDLDNGSWLRVYINKENREINWY